MLKLAAVDVGTPFSKRRALAVTGDTVIVPAPMTSVVVLTVEVALMAVEVIGVLRDWDGVTGTPNITAATLSVVMAASLWLGTTGTPRVLGKTAAVDVATAASTGATGTPSALEAALGIRGHYRSLCGDRGNAQSSG